MFSAPRRSQFDINFSLFGFPIRVSAWFWLAVLLFGQSAITIRNPIDGEILGPQGLFIFAAAMFLSILIHELGHAFAFRHYGIESQIVLYHFGGLAIPTQDQWGSATSARTPKHDLVISAAGPVAQLLGFLVLSIIVRLGGHTIPLPIMRTLGLSGGEYISAPVPFFFTLFFVAVSFYWALLNLLPVYPLDGGQIARNLFLMFGGSRAIQHSLMLSIGAGAVAALYGMQHGQPFLGFMFFFLAYSSFQALQAYRNGPQGWQ